MVPVEHTRPPGRPRSHSIDEALFRAVFDVVRVHGYGRLTIERVAALSKVSKASIYRRFGSRAELAAEALLASAPVVPVEHGGAPGTLKRYLQQIFAAVRGPAGPVLQGLMADAQLDPRFREVFRERFISARRLAFAEAIEAEYGRSVDLELILDLALGLMWYRLLVGHRSLGEQDAVEVAGAVERLLGVTV